MTENNEVKKVAFSTMIAACVLIGTLSIGIMGFAWAVAGNYKYSTLLERVVRNETSIEKISNRVTINDALIYGQSRDVKEINAKLDEIFLYIKESK